MNLWLQKWLKVFSINAMLACPEEEEGVNVFMGPNLGYERGT